MSENKMETKRLTKPCNLCKGTGEPKGYVLYNNNPCVRCGGYKTIPISSDNPNHLTQKEKKQIKIENKDC